MVKEGEKKALQLRKQFASIKELDEIVTNQKLFWVIFTWLYIDSIIKNKFVTFWIVLVFSAYLYKDELEDFVTNEELHENIKASTDNLSKKMKDIRKIKKDSLVTTFRELEDLAKSNVRERVTDKVSSMF